jgi:hypothetical protein
VWWLGGEGIDRRLKAFEARFSIAAAFQPVALVGVSLTVVGAHRAATVGGFFVAFEFAQGGQQCPAQPVNRRADGGSRLNAEARDQGIE